MPFRDRHPTGPSPIAPEPASPLAVAITAIESNQMAYGAKVYEELFALDFRLREKFPFKMSAQYNRIVVGLIHVLRAVDQAATRSPSDLERVLEFARQLGRDHRKYLVERCHYNLMELALRRALAYIDITDAEVTQAFSSAVHTLATTMVDAAEAETTPARWVARVVAVERRTRDITVVRLEAGEPVLYYPGQYLSVSVPQFPGTWRFMSPALPPGPEGYVEFHVKAVEGGRTSRQIVIGTRPGDDWILANPHGSLEIREDARDVLMVAGSTGLAPLRALILDLANRGDAPRVHLFFGAKYPGELYDLPTLWGLAQSLPWLTVQPCVEVDEDPWWLHPSWGGQIPRGLHLRKIGRLSDIVTTYGNWADRQILVSGSPSMVGETVKALVAAGTPREIIDHDPY